MLSGKYKAISIIIFLFAIVALPRVYANPGLYDDVYSHLNKHVEGDSGDILIILYNKAECSNCSYVMNQTVSNEELLAVLPAERRCMIITRTRPVEIKAYREQFSFLKPRPEIISDEAIYNRLHKILDTESYLGGIIIIDKHDKVKCKFTFKNGDYLSLLKSYIQDNK